MERVNIALVGCGDIGWVNAQAIQTSLRAKLAGVFDPNVGSAVACAKKVRCPVFGSFAETLESSDVQAVFISTPHHLHRALAEEAAQAGKHVLMEKPLTITTEDAHYLLALFQERGLTLSANYSFRLSQRVQEARKLVRNGALGLPVGVSVHHLIHKGLAYWAGGYSGRTPDSWRTLRTKAGGGILIMGLVHQLDYVQFILGSRIHEVHARYTSRAVPGDVEDMFALTAAFEDGTIGSFVASTAHAGSSVLVEEIWGTEGTISLKPDPGSLFLRTRYREISPGRLHPLVKESGDTFRSAWIDEFCKKILGEEHMGDTPQELWQMVALVEAAYRSQDSGRSESVPPWSRYSSPEVVPVVAS